MLYWIGCINGRSTFRWGHFISKASCCMDLRDLCVIKKAKKKALQDELDLTPVRLCSFQQTLFLTEGLSDRDRKAAQSLPDRKPLGPTCFKAQQHTLENDLVNDILLSSSDLKQNFVLSSFYPPLPSYIPSASILSASVLLWVPLKVLPCGG